MKKVLLFLSILNFLYMFSTFFIDNSANNNTNLFLLPFGLPTFIGLILFVSGFISLFFKEKGSIAKLSIYILIINFLVLLVGNSVFLGF